MSKPKAVLSFEDKSVELEEAQLIRIGQLLLKDDRSHQNLKEFNDLYIPVMSVASAMSDWREPTPPPPEVVSTLHTPLYSFPSAEYFLDQHPEFSRSVVGSDGDLLCTYPLLVNDKSLNVLAFTDEENTGQTDVILNLKVQRVYVSLDNQIKAIDVSTNDTVKFHRSPESPRQLLLNMSSAGGMIKLAGTCFPELGTVRFNNYGDWQVIAVDLEVERGSYDRRSVKLYAD